jgi:hypothetical protein
MAHTLGHDSTRPIVIDDNDDAINIGSQAREHAQSELADGWDKLPREMQLHILEWAFLRDKDKHVSRKTFGFHIEDVPLEFQTIRPPRSHLTDMMRKAFWNVNALRIFTDGSEPRTLFPLSQGICKFLRYLEIYTELDHNAFGRIRQIAESANLATVKHCTIEFYYGGKWELEIEDRMRPPSVHKLVSSTTAAIERWLDLVYHKESGPIRFSCPGSVIRSGDAFLFLSEYDEVRDGDPQDIEYVCGERVEEIVPLLFAFRGETEIDAHSHFAKINTILQKPWI